MSILQVLQDSKSVISIQVLVATFNGEKYLRDMLESLINQQEVNVHLIISDDGSTDSTVQICDSYSKNFQSYKRLEGPKQGSTKNFFWLIQHASEEIIFLADQDDVWDCRKAITTVLEMRSAQGAICHVSRAQILGKERILKPSHRFPMSIFKNRTQGNCIAFNIDFARLVNQLECHSEHYDWYIYLLSQMYNCCIISNKSMISYRIHDANQIGLPRFSLKLMRYIKDFFELGSRRKVTEQVLALMTVVENGTDKNKRKFLSAALTGMTGNFWARLKFSLTFLLKVRTFEGIAITAQLLKGEFVLQHPLPPNLANSREYLE